MKKKVGRDGRMHDPTEQLPLENLADSVGFSSDGMALLHTALTHRSKANEEGQESNERLEFLGDAVLGLVVGEYLFFQYPKAREGQLAKMRAMVVSAPILARRAHYLELGRYLRLGRGEALTGGRHRQSNLANAFEALVGAIYILNGLDAARSFIVTQLSGEILKAAAGRFNDYKTLLQEELQAHGGRPNYEVTRQDGPDHGRIYTVMVSSDGRVLGEGCGRSKKEAEQAAARQAIERGLSNQTREG